MILTMRRRFLASLLAATGFCAGCGDLGQFLYFCMPEQKVPAEIKSLATSDKKKEVKAMILVRKSAETNWEFMSGDAELARALHKQLSTLVTANSERLTLVPAVKVEAFKSSNPRWYELKPSDIGEHFKVDYVIYVEINQLNISNADLMYRAKADLSVRLIDVNDPDESTPPKNFFCTYPSESHLVPADESTPHDFREKFLAYAAKRLAWYFAPHPVADSHYVE